MKKPKHKVSHFRGRLAGLYGVLLSLWITGIPVFAIGNGGLNDMPNYDNFYAMADHWNIFTIGREIGQFIAVVMDKIVGFFERDVFQGILQLGTEMFSAIDLNNTHLFGSKSTFLSVLTAFLILGLVSYGVWILLHQEQTNNSLRYMFRQIIAVILSVGLFFPMIGSLWNIVGGQFAKGALTNDNGANTASMSAIEQNVCDWYWIAGKGAFDGNKEDTYGQIDWSKCRGDKSKQYYTCNPYLGRLGWSMIDPMEYMTNGSIDSFNKTITDKAIEKQISKAKAKINQKSKKVDAKDKAIAKAEVDYWNNFGTKGRKTSGESNNDSGDNQETGKAQIPAVARDHVFTCTADGTAIEAAQGSDNPLTVLFKDGLNNPPYYRYTISWIPLIFELTALAIFYFMISLKIVRILMDLIITGIIGPLFVATDFWGESGQKTKAIFRSIIDAYLSIFALIVEVLFANAFIEVIGQFNMDSSWLGTQYVRAIGYVALCYLGIHGADLFKRMNLDVDNSTALKFGEKAMSAGVAVGGAALGTAAAIGSDVAGLAKGSAETLMSLGDAKAAKAEEAKQDENDDENQGDDNEGALNPPNKSGDNPDDQPPLDGSGAGIDETERGVAGEGDEEEAELADNNEEQDSEELNAAEAAASGAVAGAAAAELADGNTDETDNDDTSGEDTEAAMDASTEAQVNAKADTGVLDKESTNAPGADKGSTNGQAGTANTANTGIKSSKKSAVNGKGSAPQTPKQEMEALKETANANNGNGAGNGTDNNGVGEGVGNGAPKSGKKTNPAEKGTATQSAVLGEPGAEITPDEKSAEPTSANGVNRVPAGTDAKSDTGTQPDTETRGETPQAQMEETAQQEAVQQAQTRKEVGGSAPEAEGIPAQSSVQPMPDVAPRQRETVPVSNQSGYRGNSGNPSGRQSSADVRMGDDANATVYTGKDGTVVINADNVKRGGNSAPQQHNSPIDNSAYNNGGPAVMEKESIDSSSNTNSNSDGYGGNYVQYSRTTNADGSVTETYTTAAGLKAANAAGAGSPPHSGESAGAGLPPDGGSSARPLSYMSKHATGKAAKQEAEYAGQGKINAKAASVFGHQQAAINNIRATHQLAQTMKEKDGHVNVAKLGARVAKEKMRVQLQNDQSYMAGGLSRLRGDRNKNSNSDSRNTAQNYQQLSEEDLANDDKRPKQTYQNEEKGN